MQPMDLSVRPVAQAERITALDTLRGFALLGILLMNIVAMGLFWSAYDDPTVAGGSTGINLWIWAILHVVAEGKMRAIFSLVFGAGIILLTSRLEATGRSSADIYYRRNLWLLAFGIPHAYLLWGGEILYPYAMCALALYPFRKMSARGLLIVAGVLLAYNFCWVIAGGFQTRGMISDGRAAVAADQGQKLTDEQQDARSAYQQWLRRNRPTAEQVAKDGEEWRGNFFQVVKARAQGVIFFHSFPYYNAFAYGDIWSMMLTGMALMKLRVLGAERPARLYGMLALIGYGIGLPVNSVTAWLLIKNHFDPVLHEFTYTTYDIGRLSVALGHAGLIMLLCRAGALKWLTDALGAVGQTALTNYVATSVISAFVFTGYGFKLYGRLQRYELYYVVGAIWAFNLIASRIWVRHFRFGPMEWCWRSLTYWKRQPMRLGEAAGVGAGAEAAVTG